MEQLYAKTLGQGPDLLILHGFLGMSDNWKTLGSRFAEAGYRVHLLDQRNHGRSFWSEAFDYPLMARDVVRYMDHKGITDALLLGHSMGGKTAMTLATSFPGRVNRLVVADIGTRRYPPHHQHILGALEALPLSEIDSRGDADTALAKSLPDWGVRQFLLKNLYWKNPGELAFRFNLEVLKDRMEEIGAALPEGARFEKESLFIRGGASEYIRDADLPGIRAHFPKARLETLAGAGHWLHAEQPDAFLQRVLEFAKS